MKVRRMLRVPKSVILTLIIPFLYGCVQAMSKGNVRTQATLSSKPVSAPLQEAVSKKADLTNIAALAIIILIIGLLMWKKGYCFVASSNKKEK